MNEDNELMKTNSEPVLKIAISNQAIDKQIINGDGFYPQGTGFDKLSKGKYWEIVDFTISDLAKHIQAGFAWMPVTIDRDENNNCLKNRKALYCNNTQTLAIDVDNVDNTGDEKDAEGKKVKVYKPELTLEEAVKHPFIQAHCALIIPSASHTEDWNKFRMVFVLPEALTSRKQIESAYKYLLEIFPCGDKACKDSSRFFYGAKDKPIVHIKPEAQLPEDFICNVFDFESKKSKQYDQKLEQRTKWVNNNNANNDTDEIIQQALDRVPSRLIGGNTYFALRDCIWALVAHYGEAKAVQIMEAHSPSHGSWNVAKIAAKYESSRGITLGTLFFHAEANGFRYPARPPKNSKRQHKKTFSEKAQELGIKTADKSYVVQLTSLVDRKYKDILQGVSGTVSMANLVDLFKELNGWEKVVSILAPDTFSVVKAIDIVEKVALRYHFTLEQVKTAIAADCNNTKELKPFLYDGDTENKQLVARIELWRFRFFEKPEQDSSDETKKLLEEIENKEKKEREYLRDRLTGDLNDNLIFNIAIQSWYRYRVGIWKRIDVSEVEKILRHFERDLTANDDDDLKGVDPTTKELKESLARLKSDTQKPELDTAPKHLIPLIDGVLNRHKIELIPYERNHHFTWCLPYRWSDRNNGCEQIKKWLLETMQDDESKVQLLRAWLNACVTGRSDLHRYLECIGKSRTGKSTFQNLVIALVGMSNIKSTSLANIGNRFEKASFFGKRVIVFTDSDKYGGSMDSLKSLTGHDPIPYEEKNKQQCTDFIYRGMVMLFANEAIQSTEKTNALVERRLTVPFERYVEAGDRRELLEVDGERVWGEFSPYLAGTLKWVIDMSDQDVTAYLRNTAQTVPSLTIAKHQAIFDTNPISRWVDENIVVIAEAKTYVGKAKKILIKEGDVSREEFYRVDDWLYANYCDYCKNTGLKPFANNVFSGYLYDLMNQQLKFKEVKQDRDSFGSYIQGIAIRDNSKHYGMPSPVRGAIDEPDAW
jgi:phage/plasmid-associated DNA primase